MTRQDSAASALTRWAVAHARTTGHSGSHTATENVKAGIGFAAPDPTTFRLEHTLSGHTARVLDIALAHHPLTPMGGCC
ncbi:MAG: hypothetical protein LC799_09245 [Actinobacteria bacterium]|nr:hypothetical protein [Actinomycetota bacterium]